MVFVLCVFMILFRCFLFGLFVCVFFCECWAFGFGVFGNLVYSFFLFVLCHVLCSLGWLRFCSVSWICWFAWGFLFFLVCCLVVFVLFGVV